MSLAPAFVATFLGLRSSSSSSSFPAAASSSSCRRNSHACSSSSRHSYRLAYACLHTAPPPLPPKLSNIVRLFQLVPEPRSKYEQLLHYAKTLKPLAPHFHIPANKVHGCVSQVWVRAFLHQNKVYYEADSDSLLTKGLAALLVEGLSGCQASDILRVSPDFIQQMGLNQSLTPSRSNGFLNMLKLMQKKALELCMESEGVSMSSGLGSGHQEQGVVDPSPNLISETVTAGDIQSKKTENPALGIRQQSIHLKLETALDPVVLEVEDVSHQHAGHSGVQTGSTETHFNLKIVSPKFEGRSLVKRHRMVYDLLQEELQNGLHALSIVAKTPAEVE